MKRCLALALTALTGASLSAAGGYGVGIQTAIAMGGGHTLVPRLDFLHATDSSTEGDADFPINLSATANIFSLGADYDYFLGGRSGQGFYLLGGLGLANASIAVSGSGPGGASASTTSHQTVLYPEAGLGYQFNRYLGAELLYKDMNFKDVLIAVAGVTVGESFSGSVQASLVVRF